MLEKLENELDKKMSKAIDMLDKELSGVRTGRTSIHLLDHIGVEIYGSKMPICQVATVSTPDAKTLSVQVWDKSVVKTVEKAIADANLGVTTSSDGQLIHVNFPPLSTERRRALTKIAYKYSENTKIVLRNIRRDGMDKLKNLKRTNEISKDTQQDYGRRIQKLTDKFIGQVESTVIMKEREIIDT